MSDRSTANAATARRHLRFGWWALLVFATLGLALELLHGFKVRVYLDVSNETRRLMWTLAHAHGTLLAVINILFGLTLPVLDLDEGRQRLISRSLVAATVLVPGGFFTGGILFYAGDPGLGVLLVPVGAVLLLTALFLVARESSPSAGGDAAGPGQGQQGRSSRAKANPKA